MKNNELIEKIIYTLSIKKDTKWSQKELALHLGVNPRKVRNAIEIINKTVDEKNVIILSGQKGFWIPSDKKQVKENVKQLKSQALKMLKRYHTILKKAGFPEDNLFKGVE